MKNILALIIGIGLCLSFITAAAAAGSTATLDVVGKKLYIDDGKGRGTSVRPIDIPELKFELDKLPADKSFVKGKIFKFQFKEKFGNWPLVNWVIFTKWAKNKVELFYSGSVKGEEQFLDCVSGNDGYKCVRRGRQGGRTYKMIFKDQTITITMSNGDSAEAEVGGKF